LSIVYHTEKHLCIDRKLQQTALSFARRIRSFVLLSIHLIISMTL